MSEKNTLENISKLFELENAKLTLTTNYKNRHSILKYVCRYGEQHTTTVAAWKQGRRCACFKKWSTKLNIFNNAKQIIEKYDGRTLFSLADCTTTRTSLRFINCSGDNVKMSLYNLQLCEKIESLKEDIISYYIEDKKLEDVTTYFKHLIIPMALRLWGHNKSDGNRFKKIHIPKEDLYNMYWVDKKHPVVIANKYGCSITVVVRTMKKYNIPLRTKSQARMGELNPIYHIGHSEVARSKMSQAFVNGRPIGYHTNWGKTSKYTTLSQGIVTMRSSWEVRVADYLTENGKEWLYEPYTFKLSDTVSYRPDFYIPEDDLYIEVKGRLLDLDIEKITLFRDLGFTLLLWDRAKLESLNLISSSGKIIYIGGNI